MGTSYDGMTPDVAAWIERQRMFFVATAPLAGDGLINCSPKGMDAFRILGPREVAYLDLTGSGVETIAHTRENGRIVFMFCAFDGAPKIVRLHGRSQVVPAGSQEFDRLIGVFPSYAGGRAIVRATLTRISESCGYAVPRYEYTGDRDTLVRWAQAKGEDGLAAYRRAKNVVSLEGLPGLDTAPASTLE